MVTLVLHQRYDADSQLLWQEAVTRGWDTLRLRGYEAGAIPAGELAIYGGYMWGGEVARQAGIELLSPPDDWLLKVPSALTGRSVEMCSGSGLRNLTFPRFIKSASGRLIESRVYHSAADLPPQLGEGEQFLVQEPVVWLSEYRAFVVDGEIKTVSCYLMDGQLAWANLDPTIATSWLQSVMSQLPLVRSMVVDVGLIAGRGWAVVEANPVWCSGIYGCDAGAVLDVVRLAATRV